VQDKWFGAVGDNFASELRLLERWVDYRILVVFKDTEELIEPDIDRGWLNHRLMEGFDAYASGGNFASNIAITK
jgi:hypothetical protein